MTSGGSETVGERWDHRVRILPCHIFMSELERYVSDNALRVRINPFPLNSTSNLRCFLCSSLDSQTGALWTMS